MSGYFEAIEAMPIEVLRETLEFCRTDVARLSKELRENLSADQAREVFKKWSEARNMRNTILDEIDRRQSGAHPS